MQDKFMHRETTISRDIKLLKTKFEILEKNRQFRSLLQQSKSNEKSGDTGSTNDTASGLDGSRSSLIHDLNGLRKNSTGLVGLSNGISPDGGDKLEKSSKSAGDLDESTGNKKRKKRKKSNVGFLRRLFRQVTKPLKCLSLARIWPTSSSLINRQMSSMRGKSNRVSSIISVSKPDEDLATGPPPVTTSNEQVKVDSINATTNQLEISQENNITGVN